ncbi:MAG: hypothetical protein L0Y62_07815, partial [Nitrospirae bacterium]|nr:hypothetical protein [Nitrospirota bacterium]
MMYKDKMLIRILLILPLILLVSSPQSEAFDLVPQYNLEVSVDTVNLKITATANIQANAGKEMKFLIGRLRIIAVSLDKDKVNFNVQGDRLRVFPSKSGRLEILYEGIFSAKDGSDNVINQNGLSLTGLWYPRLEGLIRYSLKVTLPDGFEAVSEAEDIKKAQKDGRTEFSFDFPYHVDGITLIATNKYEIIRDDYKGIGIFAYFFKEDVGYARQYIEYTKKYLDLYERLIGRYPYKRFSIVENFLPTGYSMPTFTLLGQEVIKLPFIVETSLGHEALHQWFGNSVYIDYEKGNWAEGLTTYLSDHLYEDQKGRGWEYRKQILMDYHNYVNEKNEFPVRRFRGRTDFPSKSIGYGKTAMIFQMLKNKIGQEIFFLSLRDFINENMFRRASWHDIKETLERNSQNDLKYFFNQWLDRKGLPDIKINNTRVMRDGSKFMVSFDITQGKENYVMDVPVTLRYSDGKRIKRFFKIDKAAHSFSVTTDEWPLTVALDEDYELFRMPAENEIPPLISRIL